MTFLERHPYTHVRSHLLREFIAAPDVSGNSNADTEVPNDEDECINSIEGDETRQEVRWCKYRKIEVNCMERPQQLKGWLICSTLMFTLYQQLIPWNITY